MRGRASRMFKHDGSEVWVSSELGGTVSVIDPVKHVVTHKISFDMQGLRGDAIQPVGIQFTKDDATAFVALGPANRVAVIDAKTYKVRKYLLVGQRVWQMAFTPDQKYLLTTNGLSNDISVIDVAGAGCREVDPGRAAALGRGRVAEMTMTAVAEPMPDHRARSPRRSPVGDRRARRQPCLRRAQGTGGCQPDGPAARFTALLGLNGAGKTTLFSLITRLYDTQAGLDRACSAIACRASRARRCASWAWCSRRARSISISR